MNDEERSIFPDDNFREARTPRSVVKPLAEAQLVAVRELRNKQKKMRRIISEVCWYIAYLVLISIVAYGNRDPKAYLVTKTMNDLFVENKYAARLRFEEVSYVLIFARNTNKSYMVHFDLVLYGVCNRVVLYFNVIRRVILRRTLQII